MSADQNKEVIRDPRLRWSLQQALVESVREFTPEGSKVVRRSLSLAYTGGVVSCSVTGGQFDELKPLEGKYIEASGPMRIRQGRNGKYIQQDLDAWKLIG